MVSIHGSLGYAPNTLAAAPLRLMLAPPASSIAVCKHQGCHMARVSQAGAWSGLQLLRHGDMQGFDSSSLARVVAILWSRHETRCLPVMVVRWRIWHRLYGATAARLTPDQKVGSSNLSAVMYHLPLPRAALRRPLGVIRFGRVAPAPAPDPQQSRFESAWRRLPGASPARRRRVAGASPPLRQAPARPSGAWFRSKDF